MTTIREIAAVAGVSPATVSRVLNGGTRVAPDKADRVHAAIAQLGWHPDGVARSLRRGVSDVWAAIIPDIENPHMTAVVRGVEDIAHRNGYSVVLCNSDDEAEKEAAYIRIAVRERMAGAIIIPSSFTDTDLTPLHRAGIPVVCVIRRHVDEQADGVFVDDRRGARLATEHLIANGARRLGCVTGPLTTSTGTDRLEGFLDAVRAAGLPVDESLVRHANFRYDGGYEATTRLLVARPRPDAILATNNVMAVAVLDACTDEGVAVPEDILIAGFETVPWSRYLKPRLTHVDFPARALGESAAGLILDRRSRPQGRSRVVVYAPALDVERSSTPSHRSVGARAAVASDVAGQPPADGTPDRTAVDD
jgi:LacI family transcriptional regulator